MNVGRGCGGRERRILKSKRKDGVSRSSGLIVDRLPEVGCSRSVSVQEVGPRVERLSGFEGPELLVLVSGTEIAF